MCRIDDELARRVDLCFLVCGKVLPNGDDGGAPAGPNVAPGGEFGNDVDLQKLNSECPGSDASDPKYKSIEHAIGHAARLHQHLPIARCDVPSLLQLQGWSRRADEFNSAESLYKQVWECAKKENLFFSL